MATNPSLFKSPSLETSIPSLELLNASISEEIYTPLQENTTRLVKLHKRGRWSPIHCTLCNVDLNNAPEYEALSYVWGSQNIQSWTRHRSRKCFCLGVGARISSTLQKNPMVNSQSKLQRSEHCVLASEFVYVAVAKEELIGI